LDGDYVRGLGPFKDGDQAHTFGGYFQSVNRNKRSIALNLKEAEGREILRELVKSADVLIENYRAGVLDRLGLSYESLREIRPQLVYGAIRGFGDTRTSKSPYTDWPAYDVVAQAMGGIMGITGEAGGEPTKVGPGVGDIVPAIMCAFGVLAAVYRAKQTGRGQFVDVSMVDTILALCERIVYQHSYEGKIPGPEGQRHPFLTPFGIVPCKDGHITVACHTDPLWKGLCRLIGRAEMADDPRLETEAARRLNSDLTYSVVSEFTRQKTKRELIDVLGGNVPFAPVYDVADIFSDPHFAAQEMLVELENSESMEKCTIAGVPVKMSETPGGVRSRAPMLSEHADEILAAIGIGAEEMQSLRERGVIG
jgi:crotonobetainyl-CoA:carnitine CoA-transferase CaiB-like acyl-CoA transferase